MEVGLAGSQSGLNGRTSGRLLANPIAALCKDCAPVRHRSSREPGERGLAANGNVKQQHLAVSPGTDIVTEGERNRGIYTVCTGWLIRYHRLGAGERQILDVLLPGDTTALASVLLGTSNHSVQAITSASLCLLSGRQVVSLLQTSPRFAFDVLRDRMEDERRADARVTMLGRMRAEEKLGYFMLEIFDRLQRRGMANGISCPFPLRRIDVADAVGLSKVHVSRAMRELRAEALVEIRGQDMIIPDMAKLAGRAGYVRA